MSIQNSETVTVDFALIKNYGSTIDKLFSVKVPMIPKDIPEPLRKFMTLNTGNTIITTFHEYVSDLFDELNDTKVTKRVLLEKLLQQLIRSMSINVGYLPYNVLEGEDQTPWSEFNIPVLISESEEELDVIKLKDLKSTKYKFDASAQILFQFMLLVLYIFDMDKQVGNMERFFSKYRTELVVTPEHYGLLQETIVMIQLLKCTRVKIK